MTMLGLDEEKELQQAAEDVVARASWRGEIVKRIALGGGTSIGIAVVFGAFELLHQEPHDAFPLLKAWGPWSIVSIVAIYVAYDVLKRLIHVAEALGVRVARAIEKLAAAQQQQADKDDRQYDRMITLTTYSNTRADRLLERMDESDKVRGEQLERILAHFEQQDKKGD